MRDFMFMLHSRTIERQLIELIEQISQCSEMGVQILLRECILCLDHKYLVFSTYLSWYYVSICYNLIELNMGPGQIDYTEVICLFISFVSIRRAGANRVP